MSTRSRITYLPKNPSDDVLSIYCHFDGYPEYVGKLLKENYDTDEKILELMGLGALSYLSSNIQGCLAYHRDRGESFNRLEVSLEEFNTLGPNYYCNYEQFHYIWKDNKWTIYSMDQYKEF